MARVSIILLAMAWSVRASPQATISLDNPVGTIAMFSGSTPPPGYLLCDGSVYGSSLYPQLYAVVGNTYGGSGAATPPTFQVPDMRGVMPIGVGSSGISGVTSTPRSLGQVKGSESTTLYSSNVPEHTHSGQTGGEVMVHGNGVSGSPFAAYLGGAGPDNWEWAITGSSTTNPSAPSIGATSSYFWHVHSFTTDTGSGVGAPFTSTPPALGLNFIIKAGMPSTSTPTPSATPGACPSFRSLPHTDLQGTLVGSAAFPASSYPGGFAVSSEAECAQQCCAAATATGCNAYVFANSFLALSGGSTAPCFLYDAVNTLVPSSAYSSGVQISAYSS